MNQAHSCDICTRPLTWWDRMMGRATCGRLVCQKAAGSAYYYDGKRRPRSVPLTNKESRDV